MLRAKQGSIKYDFLSLWYDSTWDWTPVSWTIGKTLNSLGQIKTYLPHSSSLKAHHFTNFCHACNDPLSKCLIKSTNRKNTCVLISKNDFAAKILWVWIPAIPFIVSYGPVVEENRSKVLQPLNQKIQLWNFLKYITDYICYLYNCLPVKVEVHVNGQRGYTVD